MLIFGLFISGRKKYSPIFFACKQNCFEILSFAFELYKIMLAACLHPKEIYISKSVIVESLQKKKKYIL